MRVISPDLVPYVRGYNTARDYLEALVIERTAAGAPLAHIRDTKAQWAEADGGAGAVDAIFTRFDDGTLRLKDTTNTLFTRTSHPNNQTDLDRVDPFDAALIEWGGTDSSDIEILRVKLWLNPRVSGSQKREVDRWRLLLFARTVTDANGNYYAPLAEPLDVLVTGDTASEVTFDYSGRSARPKPKSVNPVNELPDGGGTFLGNPVTLFQVIALTASGDSAGNVALGVNDAETSFTSTGNTLTRRRFKNFGWFQDQGVALGVPHIVLESGTYAASETLTFSSGNLFDLGGTPTKDVELIGIGQTPPGTSITYRVRNAADSAYVDFTNGQFENADLALTLVQSKKMQVVLTSNPAGTVSPTLRRLGRQAINRIDFSRVATIDGYEQAFDPETHKVEIPRPRLVAVKDGPRDFSSKIEKLLAENFVNDIRIRWLVGDKAIGRSKWTHMDDFLVLDSTPRQPIIELQLVGLCALLKDLAPPFSPGTNYAPDGTVTIGTWTDLAGGTTNIHTHIDEAVADETDGIRSVTSPSNTEIIFSLPTPTDLPGRRLFVDCDYAKDQSGGEQIDLKIRLYQTGTLVAELTKTAIGPDRVQSTMELTEAQISQLTDLPNIRLAFVANAPSPGTGRRAHVYWARFRSGGKREVVSYTNQTLKAVYDDLIANRLAIPANLRGPGIENTTTTVSKQITGLRKRGPNVKEVVGKTEVEAIAFLADRLIGSGEGRIKAFDVSPGQPVRVVFRSRRIKIGEASPGHERRIPEYFVPYRWDATKEEFKDEVRAFHTQSILRIGTVGLGPPQWLEEEISKWIDSDALAESIGQRIVERLGTGEMLWSFVSVDRYPELEVGDVVAVETDLFVSRDPNINQELRGRRWAVGPLQRAGSGRFFTVHPRGYADILSDKQLASRLGFILPEIATMHLSKDTANVVMLRVGVTNGRSVRAAMSTSAAPSEATTRAAGFTQLDAAGNALITLSTLAAGQTAYVSAFAYENGDGTGTESEIRTVQMTAGTTKVIFLTSGSSWTVPSDFNTSSNTIEGIGGGGGGTGGIDDTRGGGGGGGGEYRKIVNFSPGGGTVSYAIGAGGSAGVAGGNTTFNTSSLIANGGAGASGVSGGAGGTGGTGAGGNNRGGNGANGESGTGDRRGGGGGGAGGQTSQGGDANSADAFGGAGGTPNGGAGGTPGNDGGDGTTWTSNPGATTAGPGGGGGGGQSGSTAGLGGFRGGGGGGGSSTAISHTDGANGRAGIIVITYLAA